MATNVSTSPGYYHEAPHHVPHMAIVLFDLTIKEAITLVQ